MYNGGRGEKLRHSVVAERLKTILASVDSRRVLSGSCGSVITLRFAGWAVRVINYSPRMMPEKVRNDRRRSARYRACDARAGVAGTTEKDTQNAVHAPAAHQASRPEGRPPRPRPAGEGRQGPRPLQAPQAEALQAPPPAAAQQALRLSMAREPRRPSGAAGFPPFDELENDEDNR